MAYYVDTGCGFFVEFGSDELPEARALLEHSMEAAEDFESKMGFLPFWAKTSEIRKGRKGLLEGYTLGEAQNQHVVANTKSLRPD